AEGGVFALTRRGFRRLRAGRGAAGLGRRSGRALHWGRRRLGRSGEEVGRRRGEGPRRASIRRGGGRTPVPGTAPAEARGPPPPPRHVLPEPGEIDETAEGRCPLTPVALARPEATRCP